MALHHGLQGIQQTLGHARGRQPRLLYQRWGRIATSCKRTYERHWTPVDLDFDVADVDAATADVKRLGGTVEDVKRGDWGAAAFCAAPFGNGFCVVAICS